MAFDRKEFTAFILDAGVIGFHDLPITLKSGRKSHFYINWRHATNDAYLLDRLTDFIVEYVVSEFPECQSIYGVPEGATKTAVISALKWAKRSRDFVRGSHVVAMGRAKPKDHGAPADRDFIGVPEGPTLVLEDTATTGGSLLATLGKLKEAGVDVIGCLSLTDRDQKGLDGLTVAESLAAQVGPSIKYRTMAGALALIPEAARKKELSPALRGALEAEFKSFGIAPLKWS